jgi:hypothetical protein
MRKKTKADFAHKTKKSRERDLRVTATLRLFSYQIGINRYIMMLFVSIS